MAVSSVRKAVIPAAGFGTRSLPAAKAVPKEMLAIVDKPMIQYAVEEAVASGIERIGIVVSRWKTAIPRHFGRSPEIEEFLRAKGQTDLVDRLTDIGRPADIAFIEQSEPRGLGHAVLMAESFVGDEPFSVLNPDTIYDGPVPCLRQLLDVFAEKQTTVVVLGRIGREGMGKYGVVNASAVADRVFKIEDVAEKPGPAAAFSDLAILGRYVFTPDIFDAIRRTPPGRDGEVQITDAIRHLLGKRPVYGVLFEGSRYDAGDKFGLIEATIRFALKRPEFRDRLKALLEALTSE